MTIISQMCIDEILHGLTISTGTMREIDMQIRTAYLQLLLALYVHNSKVDVLPSSLFAKQLVWRTDKEKGLRTYGFTDLVLGEYSTVQAAAAAYNDSVRKLCGDLATQNRITLKNDIASSAAHLEDSGSNAPVTPCNGTKYRGIQFHDKKHRWLAIIRCSKVM